MMRVIGADDKGNVIIEKTCSTGRTEEMLADIAEVMKRVAEIQEKIGIRREARGYQRKRCSRIRSRTRQQAKSTLKYNRYELRIYGRKERQGFYE